MAPQNSKDPDQANRKAALARLDALAERIGRAWVSEKSAVELVEEQRRGHYREDVDFAPTPEEVLALAEASLADVPAADLALLTRRLQEPDQ